MLCLHLWIVRVRRKKYGCTTPPHCIKLSMRVPESVLVDVGTFAERRGVICFLFVGFFVCLSDDFSYITEKRINRFTWHFRDRSEKENKAHLRDLIAATGLVIFLKLDSNHRFFSPCDLEIWRMTSKNYRALLYYVKLCASFEIHRRFQTGVKVWKNTIRVKIGDILSRVTLKFDGWPCKPTGHLFYTTSSFVHHFKSIGAVKLELQSGNAQLSSVTLRFGGWPWKTIGHISYVASCFFASFHSHQWIQTGVTVQKRSFWVKVNDFLAVCPWNLTDDLEKQ